MGTILSIIYTSSASGKTFRQQLCYFGHSDAGKLECGRELVCGASWYVVQVGVWCELVCGASWQFGLVPVFLARDIEGR